MSLPKLKGIPADVIPEIVEIYEQGKYLTAWKQAQEFGEFRQWTDPVSQVVGGRLAHQLGGMRLSRLQLIRAYRQAPLIPEVSYWYGYVVLEKKGPWNTWRYLMERGELHGANVEIQASWYALHAQVAAQLRDFELADTWIRRATLTHPSSAWVQTVQGFLLESEDRYDEALQQTEVALKIRPWYRSAVQGRAHLLMLLGRDVEAIELLRESLKHIESAAVAQQLTAHLLELKDYDGAEQSVQQYVELAPLTDKHGEKWLAAVSADICYFQDRIDEAVEHAKKCGKGFFEIMAERLADPEKRSAKRNSLPMPFVRQHHMTCVPATLTAIAGYWNKEVDHLNVAEKICYAGTSALNERKWAVENGWHAREFTVTEDSIVDLIDAGIPISLTTVQPGNAHQQAINGYDLRRGSLIILDPFIRKSEAITGKLLESQAAFGPRGMAMVPADQADKLHGIDLPDAAIWDQLHAFDACLEEHRRDDAIVVLAKLDESHAAHRVSLEAHRRLAVYDGNPQEMLKWVDKLLEQHPEDEALHLQRLSVLKGQSHRDDRLAAYQSLIAKEDCHPLFKRDYAKELADDHTQVGTAMFYLKQVIHQTHTDGRCYHDLATVLWDMGPEQRPIALELFRFAACLEDHDEALSEDYLIAAQHFNQSEAALEFLRKRFERFGKKSGWPAETLSQAYRRLCRENEAMQVLEEAIQLRPDDGGLLIYAADVFASAGTQYVARAKAMLEQAKGKAPRMTWLRTAAFICSIEGRLEDSLAHWREIAEHEPFATDAHASITRLLAETQDVAAGLAYLEEAARQFPYHYPLQELRIMWLREEAPEQAESALRETLEKIPDPWIVRELAHLLTERGELDEAKQLAKRSGEMEQNAPNHFHLVGAIQQRIGNMQKARAAYRKAIELSVDNGHAISELMACCADAKERRAELAFVHEQLKKQTLFGEGITAFRVVAQDTLDAEELLDVLREANTQRGDLWESWSALAQQLAMMDRLDEAFDVIARATDRFPLNAKTWLDRALVSRARADFADELAAAEAAWAISPFWHPVVDTLCEVHERNGDFDKARALLKQLVQSDPLESRHHARLAELLWKMDEQDAAMDRAARAIELDPGNRQAWSMLDYWSGVKGTPERTVEMARELTRKRPNEARSWLMLARILEGPDSIDERFDALKQCLRLNERLVEAYSIRAFLYAEGGEADKARRECRPKVFGKNPPIDLKLTLARLEADLSGPEKALEVLEEAITLEPEFYAGWQQLADWYRVLDDPKQYLRCAREIARIEPHDPESLGYLGEALATTDRKDEAVEVLERAFEVAPGYEFAGFMLFDLYVEQKKVKAAGKVLNRMKQHVEHSHLLQSRLVQLDALCKDRENAVNGLFDLCLMEGDLEWALPNAIHAMRDQHWEEAVMRTLAEAIEQENCNGEAGAAWGAFSVMDCLIPQAHKRLRTMAGQSFAGERAVHEFLNTLISSSEQKQALKYVKDNQEWMVEKAHLWGSVGFVYAANHHYAECVTALGDWRDREDELEPWMLFNLVEALRALDRDDEAHAASEFAVQIDSVDVTKDLHRIWLTLDDPFADPDELAYCALQIEPDSINPSIGILHALLFATFQMSGGFGEPAPFRDVKETIKTALKKYNHALKSEPAYRRFVRRYIKMLAAEYSGLGPLLFGWSRVFYR